jgi:hypothetical protein
VVDHHSRRRFVGEHRLEMLRHNQVGIAAELARMSGHPVGALEELDPRGKQAGAQRTTDQMGGRGIAVRADTNQTFAVDLHALKNVGF